MNEINSGWDFIEFKPDSKNQEETNLSLVFAKTFSNPDGRKVFDYLKKITTGRVLSPSVSEAELRHLEGQRALFFHILALIENGSKSKFNSN